MVPEEQRQSTAASAEAGGGRQATFIHGKHVWFNRSRYQGHLLITTTTEEALAAVQLLLKDKPLRYCSSTPYAYRIDTSDDNRDEVLEGCSDGKDPGSGRKLLNFLKTWDARNVTLIVTRCQYGPLHHLVAERYRIILERAAAVMSDCYAALMSTSSSSTEAASNDKETTSPEAPTGGAVVLSQRS